MVFFRKNNQKIFRQVVYITEDGMQATSNDESTWNYRNPDQPEEEWRELVYESSYVMNPYKKIEGVVNNEK